MKRVVVRLLKVVAVLVVAACAVRGYMVWDRTRDVLPEFTAVPAGARAPAFEPVAGIRVGSTTLAEVQALTTKLGWPCTDTSMRGLMKRGREETQAKMAAAKERGEDPDAVSGASRATYISKKEQNPQVQWNCENVDLAALDPAVFTVPSKYTSAVFIFDSAELPLRYLSTSRKLGNQQDTLALYEADIARFSAVLGPPTTTMGTPDRTEGKPVFARSVPMHTQWLFADRKATIGVMNMGGRGIDVREIFEVPLPVVVTPAATQ